MAGRDPAILFGRARPCPTIEAAGTSPAMIVGWGPVIPADYVIASPVLMWTGW
jgi:hypothetical protein